jgi:hypothetical protein
VWVQRGQPAQVSQKKVSVGFERLEYLARAMAKDAREASSSLVVSLA